MDIVTVVNVVRYYVIDIDTILLMDRAIEGVEATEDAAPLAGILMDTKVDIINDPREVGWISGKRRRYKDYSLENGLSRVVSKIIVYAPSWLRSHTNGRCTENLPKADLAIRKMVFEGKVKSFSGRKW